MKFCGWRRISFFPVTHREPQPRARNLKLDPKLRRFRAPSFSALRTALSALGPAPRTFPLACAFHTWFLEFRPVRLKGFGRGVLQRLQPPPAQSCQLPAMPVSRSSVAGRYFLMAADYRAPNGDDHTSTADDRHTHHNSNGQQLP